MIVVSDIDGVLADCSHRLHYLKEKNYEKFYSEEEMLKDRKIRSGEALLENLYDEWYEGIMYLTGRPYRTEEWTRKWIEEETWLEGADSAIMLMRKNHDYRPSDIVKVETLQKYLEEIQYRGEILFIDDDPKNVVAMEKAVENCTGILFGASRLDLK